MASLGSPAVFYKPPQDASSFGSPGRARKKLQLKPRSSRNANNSNDISGANRMMEVEPPLSPRTKSSPFGAAKPREQVLRQRGIDVQSMDAKFEQKARASGSYSAAQEQQLEAVRHDLTRLETLWREANEKELPEEVFRVQAEAKRQELHALLRRFSSGTAPHKHNKKGSNGDKVDHEHDDSLPNPASPPPSYHLPPVQGAANSGNDPCGAMSRHRFGTAL